MLVLKALLQHSRWAVGTLRIRKVHEHQRLGNEKVLTAWISAHPQLKPLPDGGVPVMLDGPCQR